MLPSLYISHGSPGLMIMNNSTTDFLKQLSSTFERPKFILVISAHWVTDNLRILYDKSPKLIYDFYNFPQALYELEYNAKASMEKNDEIIKLLEDNNINIEKDDFRGGFDHGVWSPLKFMYPDADIPVIQLSIPYNFNQYELFKLGEVLSTLRDDTLIIASGSMTHNLRDLDWTSENAKVKDYAKKFRDWVVKNLEDGTSDEMLDLMNKAPYLKQNHPSLEHFIPLYVALGSSKTKVGKSLHNLFMYGNLSMDTIIFEE